MGDTDNSSFEERLFQLERSLRHWKTAGAIGSLLLLGLFAAAVTLLLQRGTLPLTQQRGVVTARKFVVVDSSGNTVAELSSSTDGQVVGLRFYSPSGTTKTNPHAFKAFVKDLARHQGSALMHIQDRSILVFGMSEGKHAVPDAYLISGQKAGASLYLRGPIKADGKYDSAELRVGGPLYQSALTLTSYAGRSAGLNVGGLLAPRQSALTLTSRDGRSATVQVTDPSEMKDGNKTMAIPGSASITLQDPMGPHLLLPREAQLALRSDHTAGLYLRGKHFKTLAELNVGSHGNPHLDLYDKKGRLRAVLGTVDLRYTRTGSTEKTAPSSLVLFDKKGKVLWERP